MKNDKLIPDSPSQLEEEFQHEFTELIDQYKKDFLTHGWSAEELAKWCKEMIDKELRESEDERVRKCLIAMVNATIWDSSNIASKKACLAWLEKQKDCILVPKSHLDPPGEDGEDGMKILEKQKEQKPVEKHINWNELTWKDINELEGIINNVHYEFRNGIGQESFGKEVLERFREYKGDEYLDEMEQKPAEWSEEDEKMVRFYEDDYNNNLGNMPMRDVIENRIKFRDWLLNRLKSLRPQPKQEWSEEDEKMRNLAIEWAEIMSAQFSFVDMDSTDFCKIISWLKSLRPDSYKNCNSRWKPSEEQMDALKELIDDANRAGWVTPGATELYEHLKKL